MKVLIATNHLVIPGGTERWTETMADGFKRLGHNVDIRAREVGEFADTLQHPINSTDTHYDLILVNHDMGLVADCVGFKIFTSHGIIEKLETPQEADAVVAISDEVGEHYGIKDVILNPIDLTKNRQTRKRPLTPEKVLAITTSNEAYQKIAVASMSLGLMPAVASKFTPTKDLPALINQADLVVSLGRGAYEALACNRPVIVYDHRPYNGEKADGLITPSNFEKIRKHNCSGRAFAKQYTVQDIVKDLLLYDSHTDYRPLVTCQDVEIIINQYINLWKEKSQ